MYAPSKIILPHSVWSRDRTYAEVLFMSTKVSNNYQVIQMVSKSIQKLGLTCTCGHLMTEKRAQY